MTLDACDRCLRRTSLVARLAGAIELARRRRSGLRELLALPDEELIGTFLGDDAAALADELREAPARLSADAAQAGLAAACSHADAYPGRLRDLRDAPAVLFVAAERDPIARLSACVGGTANEGARAVAVVGTRRASAEGLEVARALGTGLAAANVTVVSGMALGIDSAAHCGALGAGGPTVAVLPGGADVAYPASKRSLYRRLLATGCAVSEMPPGFAPYRWSFPARNRIIAALGQMTVVVEAAERSGSLITAEIAGDLGREIGAVPGPVTSWRSAGTNALLRDGATVVRHARDVLDGVLGVDHVSVVTDPAVALEPRLASVLRAVAGGRDTVAALAGTPDQAQRTLAALTELELIGLVRRVTGGRYVVVPRP